jgi:hypothetical protein
MAHTLSYACVLIRSDRIHPVFLRRSYTYPTRLSKGPSLKFKFKELFGGFEFL